jgi:glucose/arabinose dehydrogenase
MMLRSTPALPALLLATAAASTPAGGQTLATFDTERGPVEATVFADDLVHPWAIAFLPGDAGALVTERPGRLRHVGPDGMLSEPVAGVPEVDTRD